MMIDIHRMISRLGKLMKNSNLSAGNSSSRKYSISELLLTYGLRTAEGK